MSISDSEWQWEYQINLVISNSNDEILELLVLVRVSLNTSTVFSHHSVTPEHEDVVVTDRINNLEKWLNWDEKSDENQFKNSNVKELKMISS